MRFPALTKVMPPGSARVASLVVSLAFAAMAPSDARAQAAAPVLCDKTAGELADAYNSGLDACIARLGGVVERSGNAIKVRTRKGAPVTYEIDPKACDSDEAENCRKLDILAWLPAANTLFVEETGYESYSYTAINLETGEKTELFEEPHFSPSFGQFIVVNANEMDGRDNDLTMFSFDGGKLRQTFAYYYERQKRGQESWSFGKWIDEDHVALSVTILRNSVTRDVTLARQNGKWALGKLPPNPARK